MHILRHSISAAVIVLVSALSAAARADVPPPDACSLGAGMICNNAGPNSDEPGVCVSSMCPHTGPGPDGGLVTTMNPCVLCMPNDAGSTTSSSSSGGTTSSSSSSGGTTSSNSGGTTSASGSSSSGSVSGGSCAVGTPNRRGIAVAAVGFALALLGLRRKRS
jgi:hypothetical protein